MDVGRKVLGPHPGLAIVKFWQGVVEIILRVITLVSLYSVSYISVYFILLK